MAHDEPTADEVRAALERVIASEDLYRRSLSYELHDTVIQLMVAAKMAAETAQVLALKGTNTQSAEALNNSIELLTSAIQAARRLISHTLPLDEPQSHLVPALEQLAQDLMRRTGFHLQIKPWADEPELSPLSRVTLLRTISQAVDNAVRHSGAQEATVTLTPRDNRVIAQITDPGSGFDTQQVPAGHYGLTSIRDRCRLAGGEAQIVSRPGHGTTVTIDLPCLTSETN